MFFCPWGCWCSLMGFSYAFNSGTNHRKSGGFQNRVNTFLTLYLFSIMCFHNTYVKRNLFIPYNVVAMPRKLKHKLPPLNLGNETTGQRIALLRKEHGLTQKELAEKIGIKRTLVTDYEIGRLRLNDEMVIRFALALGVSADTILGLASLEALGTTNLKLTKRIRKIEQLPPTQKKSLINTIDAYLKAHKKD